MKVLTKQHAKLNIKQEDKMTLTLNAESKKKTRVSLFFLRNEGNCRLWKHHKDDFFSPVGQEAA